MRRVDLGTPPSDKEAQMQWIINSLKEIEQASFDESDEFYDAFAPSNVTTSRTFDADTVTLAELADIVGTLITDFKDRIY